MALSKNFELNLYVNGKNIYLSNEFFGFFRIVENLNYLTYYAELMLKQRVWWEALFLTGEEIRVDITIFGREEKEEDNYYSYKFILFSYKLYNDFIILTLVPYFFNKLYENVFTKGYNETVNNIVKNICNECGVEFTEFSTLSQEKRIIIQSNSNYFTFLKYINKYIEECLIYINKENKLEFIFYKDWKNKQVKMKIPKMFMGNLKLENNIYSLSNFRGKGVKSYYFDWESGEMKNYSYISEKYGIKREKDISNFEIFYGNPISPFYPSEKYTKNEISNIALRKNLFKMFFSFFVEGVYGVNLGDKIFLDMVFNYNKDGEETVFYQDEKLSGEYFVYGVSSIFSITSNKSLETNILLSTPFIFIPVEGYSL